MPEEEFCTNARDQLVCVWGGGWGIEVKITTAGRERSCSETLSFLTLISWCAWSNHEALLKYLGTSNRVYGRLYFMREGNTCRWSTVWVSEQLVHVSHKGGGGEAVKTLCIQKRVYVRTNEKKKKEKKNWLPCKSLFSSTLSYMIEHNKTHSYGLSVHFMEWLFYKAPFHL